MEKKRIRLADCPCCQSQSEVGDMLIAGTKMWQVICSSCGLSSELDSDIAFTVQRWNKRLESSRLKRWITLLAALLPLIAVLAFLSGSYFGLQLFSAS